MTGGDSRGQARHRRRAPHIWFWHPTGDTAIELSAKEFSLLEIFMRHPGLVLSRRQLREQAWKFGFENRSNVVEVYIRYLRKRIDLPFDRVPIETGRGAGYRLRRDGGR